MVGGVVRVQDPWSTKAAANPNRRRLLEILESQEYVSTQELLARSGLGWGTLLYHLDILMQADLVGTQLAGKRRLYFLRRAGMPSGLPMEARLSPNLGRVIEAVLSKAGRSQVEFTEATGLSQRMCSYYLQKLQERGLVVGEADGTRVRYHPTPRLLECFPRADTA